MEKLADEGHNSQIILAFKINNEQEMRTYNNKHLRIHVFTLKIQKNWNILTFFSCITTDLDVIMFFL